MSNKFRRSQCLKGPAEFFGVIAICVTILFVLFPRPAIAFDPVNVFGGPLTVTGYINQGVQFGVSGDHYDTMGGFQQGLTQILLEGDYKPADHLKFFVSGMWTSDFAYPIYNDNDKWESRRFKDSRQDLSFYKDYESLLKEAHVTWDYKNINIRIGKQIVSWGELDGIRIMDQINPVDNRRGLSDVEFESSIIPIWLAKVEYFPSASALPSWLSNLGVEFVFNPNADFIADKGMSTGNDKYGIWGVDVTLPSPYPGYFPAMRVGSSYNNFQEPDKWNSDGYEYGLRVKGTVGAQMVSLNYFDGVENSPTFIGTGAVLEDMLNPKSYDDEGRLLIHPELAGRYYPLRFAGFTLGREMSSWRSSFLGGVAPVMRLEAQYVFDSTFATSGKGALEEFEEHDQIRAGLGLDWKVKIPFLNPKAYFTIASQFLYQYIDDFPGLYTLSGTGGASRLSKDMYSHTLRIQTTYILFDKQFNLEPFFYWQRDYNGSKKSDMLLGKLTWQRTDRQKIWLSAFMPLNDGNDAIQNKANISLNFSYSF